MTNFQFYLDSNNKLSLSSKPLLVDREFNSLKVNVIGNYLKEQRLKNNLTKKDVAKKLGFSNFNKAIINITEIEDNSKLLNDYIEKLFGIYNIQNKKNVLKELEEKQEQEHLKINNIKKDYYLSIIDNLPFLYSKLEKIIKIDRYYFSPVYDSFTGTYLVGGRNEMYLGKLLQLWKDDRWKNECPKCGGSVYILNAVGSVLSGAGSASGICGDCRENIYGITPFKKYFREIRELPKRKIPEDLNFISFETMLKELKYL